MTKARLKKHLDLLKVLHKAKPKLRRAILENVDRDVILCICDCAYNLLSGNLPLDPAHVKRLKRHKTVVRKLGSKQVPLEEKTELIQSGGFLAALLTPLLTLAVSLLAEKWTA